MEENRCGNVFPAIHLANVAQVKEFLHFECSKREERRFLIKKSVKEGADLQTQRTGII